MLSGLINEIVSSLGSREKQIVSGRYGLMGGEKQTLAALGEKYGITRERIRQIEAEALRKLQEEAVKEKLYKITSDKIGGHLDSVGGLRRDDLLISELKSLFKDDGIHHFHLRFLAEIVGEINCYDGDDECHTFWYRDENKVKQAKKFFSDFEKSVKNKKDDLIIHGKFNIYFSPLVEKHEISDSMGMNYLSIFKNFGVSPFGDFGLNNWEEINPRTIRDRAYLILKKKDEPMHFRDVSSAINEIISNEEKIALPQTVHNELIKDPRIVLIGRGIYALQDKGYVSGSTHDLIVSILKEKGPMKAEDVMNLVKKQRILKDNTILLSLQNRKNFKKLADGRISV